MKKVLVILMLICMNVAVSAQSKTTGYLSASINPFSQAGIFESKTSGAVELGINTYNTNVGVAFGTTSLKNGNAYLEGTSRTLTFGRNFSVLGTLGGGLVLNSNNFLTEYGGSVNYALSSNLALKAGYGVFNFTGKNTAVKAPFSTAGVSYSF